MKIKKMQLLMTLALVLATTCAFNAVSAGEQAARYTAGQEGKHIFLAEAREDMAALRSCLLPIYRPAARPELAGAGSSISSAIPPAQMAPSIVQPDSTAIAASPRPEIKTLAQDNS